MPGVNAVQIEGFDANEASIQTLQSCVSRGKVTEAHVGYGQDGSDDRCLKDITNAHLAHRDSVSVSARARGVHLGRPNWH